MSRHFEKRECVYCNKMIAGNRMRWHQQEKCEKAKEAQIKELLSKTFGEMTYAEQMLLLDLSSEEYKKAEEAWNNRS